MIKGIVGSFFSCNVTWQHYGLETVLAV